MRSIQSTALFLVSLLIWACDEHGTGHAHDPATVTHVPAGESHGLRLNGDEKWEMDNHTRAMFASMVERLERPEAGNVAAKELGMALQTDLDALIQGCTMTGDAHGELHKFLVVFIPAVQALASERGADEVLEVKRLLALYPQYFE